jgi:hypothetical protein
MMMDGFYRISIIIIHLFMSISCSHNIPAEDMSKLKARLTRAKEVKAWKYAPLDYKSASDAVFKCHQEITAGHAKEASVEALKASKYAEAAISKSLPMLSMDGIIEAKAAFNEAVRANAQQNARSFYADATAKIIMAENLHGTNEFWDSYLLTRQSIKSSGEARKISLEQIPESSRVGVYLQKLRDDLGALLKNRGTQFASQSIGIIRTKLGDAEKDFKKGRMRDCYDKIMSAGNDLDEAKTDIYKGMIKEKIFIAGKIMNDIGLRNAKEEFKEEIAKAELLLSEGRHLMKEKYYITALSKFSKAVEELNYVIAYLNNIPEFYQSKSERKIKEAEDLLISIKKNKQSVKLKDRIDKSAAMISQSKNLFKKKSYKESVSNSDKAIQSLKAISEELNRNN